MKITELAKRIKAARLEKQLSQQELGRALGISDKTISAYESSRATPPLPTLIKMSVILKKDLNFFTSNNQVLKTNNLRLNKLEREMRNVRGNFDVLKYDIKTIKKILDQINEKT